MKRLILLICCFAFLTVHAQDSTQKFRFGYLSYEKALQAMPNYGLVQESLSKLRGEYEAELKRVEQDFNRKYEEFLEGQRDFPETILRKRQTELREMMERNVAFKNESRKQIAEEETRLMAPLKAELDALLAQIAHERGYAFVLNTDAGAVPFINPAMGENIAEQVSTILQKLSKIERVSH